MVRSSKLRSLKLLKGILNSSANIFVLLDVGIQVILKPFFTFSDNILVNSSAVLPVPKPIFMPSFTYSMAFFAAMIFFSFDINFPLYLL